MEKVLKEQPGTPQATHVRWHDKERPATRPCLPKRALAKTDRDCVTLSGARRRGERRGLSYDRKGRSVEWRLSTRPGDKCIPKRTACTNGERHRDATARSDGSGLFAGEGPIYAGRVGRICYLGRCFSGQRSRWRFNQGRLAAVSRCGLASCRFLPLRPRFVNGGIENLIVHQICGSRAKLLVDAFRYRSFFARFSCVHISDVWG